MKREFQALFCEKPEVQSLRLTLPIYARLHHSGDLCQSCQFATHNVLLISRNKSLRRTGPVQCRERLGGLLRYYHQEAA